MFNLFDYIFSWNYEHKGKGKNKTPHNQERMNRLKYKQRLKRGKRK